MEVKKIKICIFLHFSISETLPYYVQVYIEELSRHFDKVKVLTNNSKIREQKSPFNSTVSFEYMKNQGYDFGMFYRYINNKFFENYAEIAVVNDSNILFKKLDHIFDWGRNNESDFWGLINSNEKPWFSSHLNNYHIQSHFIVFNERAIKTLQIYLQSIDIERIMNEKDLKELRRLVINDWEIGLTQYFLKNNLEVDTFINNSNFNSNKNAKGKNLTHSNYQELTEVGYPLLKKKVTTQKKKWFKRDNNLWKETIIKHGEKEWDLEKIIQEMA